MLLIVALPGPVSAHPDEDHDNQPGDYVAVSGNYQAGTWVTDFTNPAAPTTVAFSDPEPITPTIFGGAWSTYQYNGFLYESEIQSRLNVFKLAERATAGEVRLPFLNPQTQDPTALPPARS